jgi:hypothetical protein
MRSKFTIKAYSTSEEQKTAFLQINIDSNAHYGCKRKEKQALLSFNDNPIKLPKKRQIKSRCKFSETTLTMNDAATPQYQVLHNR